jgi:hypothetical protein
LKQKKGNRKKKKKNLSSQNRKLTGLENDNIFGQIANPQATALGIGPPVPLGNDKRASARHPNWANASHNAAGTMIDLR